MAKFFWHALEINEIEKILNSDIQKGLTEKDVQLCRKEFGENKLPRKEAFSGIKIFLEQFQSPLIYILLFAGIITLILEDFTDAIVIFGAVFLNTIVGYLQEHKASETLKELKKIVKYKSEVLRDGHFKIIDSEKLVPGDIVILNPGDKVPADGRIIESHNLRVNEMALTGEWISTEKKQGVLPKKTPLADRDNMVYMGTVVEDGKGKIIVVETGINTEIGKITKMVIESPEEKTPYQKKLAHFSKTIGIIIAIISFIIFIEGMIRLKNIDFIERFEEMFTTAVAVAVAAIPEGLPVAMTVILALGMQRILKKGGLVRKLSSAETLGSTSIIATDKTGTLTEGRMEVNEIITPSYIFQKKPDEKEEFLALKIASFVSEAFIENEEAPKEKWVIRGRATDKALLKAGIKKGVFQKVNHSKLKKIYEIPFNTIDKFVGGVFEEKKDKFLYICGAPEKILERCNLFYKEDNEFVLNVEKLKKLEKELEKFTKSGLRVVATAYKKLKMREFNPKELKKEIKEMVFVGFITLKDPLRKDAKESIKICREAGMKPIIVTGDHKLTAKAVAEELGFKITNENILEGKELDNLSDREFDKILDKIQIFARVEPKHKSRIIQAWQEKGEVVAMTGDGINDAPALKKADIGVALGSGTEVAKETSDLILLNDSFSIIIEAVKEGRAILDNIRKVITYLLSDSFTEVILIGFSILAGVPLPISAVQILWVNLIEDGLPDLALAFEKEEKDLMKLKPTKHNIHLLTKEMKVIIFVIGLITDFVLVGLFFWLLNKSHDIIHIRTMIFACLSVDSLFYAFSCKSLRKNLWHINPFSNKLLIAALIIGLLMLVLAIYTPLLQNLLKTVPLNLKDWSIIMGLGFLEIALIEGTKWYFIVRHQTEF